MIKLLLVALGSAIGGVARYGLSKVISENVASAFPWGTFAVNIIGCLVIGFVLGMIDAGISLSDNARLFLTVGFCGGFTTFSTFAHENYLLFSGGHFLTVASYAALSFFAGVVMAYAGHILAMKIAA